MYSIDVEKKLCIHIFVIFIIIIKYQLLILVIVLNNINILLTSVYMFVYNNIKKDF